MAFRDDTEALRARIDSLESELAVSKKTIARMKGADELVSVDIVSKRPFGWKRRVRRFRGALSEEDYEHLARLVPTITKRTVRTERVGSTFTLASLSERVLVARGEGDELILVFDEYDAKMRQICTPLAVAGLPFLLNPTNAPEWLGPVFFMVGLFVILISHALFAREDKMRFAKGEQLFDAVGRAWNAPLPPSPLLRMQWKKWKKKNSK